MSYTVHLDGTVTCDTAEEALALTKAQNRLAPKNHPAPIAVETNFERMLRDVCDMVPDMPHKGPGPKPYRLPDVLYACAMKVYLGASGRDYRPPGAPHYNAIFQYMDSAALTGVLQMVLGSRLQDVKSAALTWPVLSSKKPTARRNEGLLRWVVEKVTTMSGTGP